MENENKNNDEPKLDMDEFGKRMDEAFKTPSEGGEPAEGDQKASEDANITEEGPAGQETITDTEILGGIDEDVLDCCREYGWDDKTIVEIARKSPELFDDVREALDESPEGETHEPEPKPKPEPEPIDELKFDLDADVVGTDIKSAIDKIAEAINEQKRGLNTEKAQLEQQRNEAFNIRVDSHFDKLAKDYPELGNSTNLNRKQYNLRSELFAYANLTSGLRNIPLEKAMEIELNKYKNQGGEQQAEQKVLDKLRKHKEKFTNPPTRRHSSLASRKFASEREKIEAIMSDAYKQAGIEE